MKVVLIKDVPKLGKKGDVKVVSDGFALNSLIPKGLALSGTPDAIKKAEQEMVKLAELRKKEQEKIFETLGKIKGKSVEIEGKANEKGHLFASIHDTEIAKELSKVTGVEVSAESVVLTKPIKEVGDYEISIKVGDQTGKVNIKVKAIEA